jgi:hypothetical protein
MLRPTLYAFLCASVSLWFNFFLIADTIHNSFHQELHGPGK